VRLDAIHTAGTLMIGAGGTAALLLAALAQNKPDQRQTIVNVLYAYLRMPFTPPDEPPADGADASEAQF
jgi:hypothetical protein